MDKLWVLEVSGARIETEIGPMTELCTVILKGKRHLQDQETTEIAAILDVRLAASVIYGLNYMFTEAGRGVELVNLVQAAELLDLRDK